MISSNVKGYIFGLTTSITFGLIPLFTLPLMNNGMTFGSILLYRFFFASIALGIMMKIKKGLYFFKKSSRIMLRVMKGEVYGII